MFTVRQFASVLILAGTCLNCATVYAGGALEKFSDEHVIFYYPESRYVNVRSGEINEDGFYTYYLKLRGADAEDTLTVCNADLQHCGLNTGSLKPYWYDDDGSLMLFSSTTTVKIHASSSSEAAYEAFPACPGTDSEGSSAHGADCYELVEGSGDKTLSITYWIGQKFLHRSRLMAAKQARDILKSVVAR